MENQELVENFLSNNIDYLSAFKKIFEFIDDAEFVAAMQSLGLILSNFFLRTWLALNKNKDINMLPEILKNLTHKNTQIRLGLLRILKLLFDNHRDCIVLITRFKLQPAIQQLSKDRSLLVRSTASRILSIIKTSRMKLLRFEYHGRPLSQSTALASIDNRVSCISTDGEVPIRPIIEPPSAIVDSIQPFDDGDDDAGSSDSFSSFLNDFSEEMI